MGKKIKVIHLNKEILMDFLRKKEDYDKLKFYTSQTKLAKSINYLIEEFNQQINKVASQLFNMHKKTNADK